MYAQQYVENDLLDKSPVELIRLLYSKAIEKLHLAQNYTEVQDVRARNRCLARAMEIVAELQGALNLEAGGEVAIQLARLYDYAQWQLIEAAADPTLVVPLEAVRVLLSNLYEGWKDCEPPPVQQTARAERATSDAVAQLRHESADNEGEGIAGESIDAVPSPFAPADYSGVQGDRVWTL
jgi:flagellar protein FliS